MEKVHKRHSSGQAETHQMSYQSRQLKEEEEKHHASSDQIQCAIFFQLKTENHKEGRVW